MEEDIFDLLNESNDSEDFENLPIELQGKDLTPDKSEKLVGTFPTLTKTLYITFKSEQESELAELLGIPVFDFSKRNLYTYEELRSIKENGLL